MRARKPWLTGGLKSSLKFLDVYSFASGHGLVGVAFMWCLMLRACAATCGHTCSVAGGGDAMDHATAPHKGRPVTIGREKGGG